MLSERDWEQMQQRLTTAWHQGNLNAAMAEVDEALAQGTPAVKGQALLYRAMIREEHGDLTSAKQDWTDAVTYCGEGSYGRYVAERSLGAACEKLGTPGEALEWYRAALKTCAAGGRFSGGQALHAFLKLAPSTLPVEDEALIRPVVEKSWAVLELPGVPDPKNLAEAAEKLARR